MFIFRSGRGAEGVRRGHIPYRNSMLTMVLRDSLGEEGREGGRERVGGRGRGGGRKGKREGGEREEEREGRRERGRKKTNITYTATGGNCLTAMIATISAEEGNIWETISTLRFSQRVACVSNPAM